MTRRSITLTIEQRGRLRQALNSLLICNTLDGREALLLNLPPDLRAQVNRSNSKAVDLGNILAAVEQWPGMVEGKHPILVLIETALSYCSKTKTEEVLQKLYVELTTPPTRQSSSSSRQREQTMRGTTSDTSAPAPRPSMPTSLPSPPNPPRSRYGSSTTPQIPYIGYKPSGWKTIFHPQRKGESLIWRQHPSYLVVKVGLLLLLMLVTVLIVNSLLSALNYYVDATPRLAAVIWLFIFVSVVLILWVYTAWYNSYYELHKDSLIKHTALLGLFKRQPDVYKLNRVTMPPRISRNWLGEILGFGTVSIKMLNYPTWFDIEGVPDIDLIIEEINVRRAASSKRK